MLLTREQQIETLYAAAQSFGLRVRKEDIAWEDSAVEVNGINMHYLDWGARGKPPLLLLHGGLQNAHSWDLTAVAMKQRFHAVAPDLRGHGDSEWSPNGSYGYLVHSADISEFVSHLNWDEMVVIGLSLGGLTAIDFVANGGRKVRAFVIVDVGPELNPSGVGRIADFGRAVAEFDSVETLVEQAIAFNPRRDPGQLRYSLTHNLKQLPNGKWTWKYDRRVGGRRETSDAGMQGSVQSTFGGLWESLKKIECPTLIVRGGESEIFADSTARKMLDVMPDARLITVPDAGHTVPQDNPAGFLSAVESFFAEVRLS